MSSSKGSESELKVINDKLDILLASSQSKLTKVNSDKSLKELESLAAAKADLETKVSQLKFELKGMDIILLQNAQLEKEVNRLCNELDEVTKGVLKRGYLYKWRDREISFASKWGLRYFILTGSSLSYFVDDREHRPRRTIDLSNCFVRDEGVKQNGKYYVFGVYLNSDYENDNNNLLLRLSCGSASEAKQWIEMLHTACNSNFNDQKVHEISGVLAEDDANFKLLSARSKEPSFKELPISIDVSDMPSPTIERVKSSEWVLQKSLSRTLIHSNESPSDRRGSIASNIVMNESCGSYPLSLKPNEMSVGTKKQEKKKAPHMAASKPIHTAAVPSALSEDARQQNYRGFFNLGVIILALSNFKLIYENLANYGNTISWPTFKLSTDYTEIRTDYYSVRPEFVLISWISTILTSFTIEWLGVKKILSSRMVTILHFVCGVVNLVFPIQWVWFSQSHPGYCMLYLFQSTILWLKMISYGHVNRELCHAKKMEKKSKEMERIRAESGDFSNNDELYNNAKPLNSFFDLKDIEPPYMHYPENITLINMLYFSVAPTITYQLNFPRSKQVRVKYLASIFLRLAISLGLILYFIGQYIQPTLLQTLQNPINSNAEQLIQILLKLSIPTTYVWLLGFYFFFHLWLNLLAELTRFGDRQFYKDWWNSRTIGVYWRTWNMPVHSWMVRHMYYPIIGVGAPKWVATFTVFLFSAVLHEIIISVPFKKISGHAFFGMLFQAPLIYVTKVIDSTFGNAFIGNAFFWLVFCVIGQPVGIILMNYDLFSAHR